MDKNRRDFLKWLSVTPLVATSISGCKSSDNAAPPRKPDPIPKDAPAPKAKAPTPDPSTYATEADKVGMKRTLSYGDNLETNPECPITEPDVLGPFHRENAPKRAMIATKEEPGDRITISGRVMHHDCKTPVVGAILDIWQADAEGRYDNNSKNFRLRGQVATDDKGFYQFETIMPGHYPLGDSMRPAHIHFNVSFPGCHPLTTQLYFEGDPYLPPNDPCGVCNSGSKTLLTKMVKGAGVFDIILAKA